MKRKVPHSVLALRRYPAPEPATAGVGRAGSLWKESYVHRAAHATVWVGRTLRKSAGQKGSTRRCCHESARADAVSALSRSALPPRPCYHRCHRRPRRRCHPRRPRTSTNPWHEGCMESRPRPRMCGVAERERGRGRATEAGDLTACPALRRAAAWPRRGRRRPRLPRGCCCRVPRERLSWRAASDRRSSHD